MNQNGSNKRQLLASNGLVNNGQSIVVVFYDVDWYYLTVSFHNSKHTRIAKVNKACMLQAPAMRISALLVGGAEIQLQDGIPVHLKHTTNGRGLCSRYLQTGEYSSRPRDAHLTTKPHAIAAELPLILADGQPSKRG